MENFNFSNFLIENNFEHTDYNIHQLYEFEKIENGRTFYYCVNLQGNIMTTNENKTEKLKIDIPVPKTEEEAQEWLNDFLK